MANIIQLRNNCRYSTPSVWPPNWDSGGVALLKKNWYIQYTFYDDNTGKKRNFMVKGFNSFKTLADRRGGVLHRLNTIKDQIEVRLWNPIEKVGAVGYDESSDIELTIATPIYDALVYAKKKMRVGVMTEKSEINPCMRGYEKAINALRISHVGIGSITLKNLYKICERCGYKENGEYSADKFNRHRKVLILLYKKLLQEEVVPGGNIPLSIEKAKEGIKQKQKVMTLDQRKAVDEYLKANNPTFWRYLHIFFHSGARSAEMMRLKVKDVDLANQIVSYQVMKGKTPIIKERPIKDIVLSLWGAQVKDINPEWYVFGENLEPNATPIQSYQIAKRWGRIKKKAEFKDIPGGFYQLKHINTTETRKRAGLKAAALHNAESEKMIRAHYDTDIEADEFAALRKIDNPFS